MTIRSNQPLEQPMLAGNGDPFNVPDYNPASWVVMSATTTGMNPGSDRIIKLALKRYINGVPDNTFVSLLNPGTVLPKNIKKLTGIKAEDIGKARAFSEVAWDLVALIGNYTIVSHSAKLDVSFLNAEFARMGINRNFRFIDTEKFARKAFPDMKDYTLKLLIRKLHLLDRNSKHEELRDVDAVACLYALCVGRASMYPERL